MGRSRNGREAGFSVIEVMMAILILGVVAGGAVQGLAFTSAALGSARMQSVATNLATSVLEDARATDYVALGMVGGSPPGDLVPDRAETVDGVSYRIQTAVELVDEATLGQAPTGANYKRVTVRVTPQAAGGETFTATAIVAPPVEGARAGEAYVAARVRDAYTDAPVEGATVTLTRDGGTATATTDANGQAVFPGLAPGEASLSVSKAGYAVAATDPSALQRTLRAGEPWQPTVAVFKPATVVAQVVDDATGAAPAGPVTVTLSTPGGGTAAQTGTGGTFTFTEVSTGGAPDVIAPSVAPVTLVAGAECYDPVQVSGPVPAAGYPAVTTQAFEIRMTAPPQGVVSAVLRTGTGSPIVGAEVRITGGDQGVDRTLVTGADGAVSACLPPSGATSYALTANVGGYVARGTAAVTLGGTTAVDLVQPGSILLNHGILPGTPVRIRQGATVVRQGTTTGLLLGVGVEFHEVPPGAYTAERWIKPLLGAGSWGGAKAVTVQSGAFLSYAL